MCGDLWVQYDRDVSIVGHSIQQQRTNERGLAGADFAGELHEPTAFRNAINEVRERLAMPLTHEEVTGIGRYRERFLVESEKAGVHPPDSTLSVECLRSADG